MPNSGARPPIGRRPSGLQTEAGTESWTVRPLHRAQQKAAEWEKEENMEKNSEGIGESYEGIKKKMRAKFFIERIC